MPTPPAIPKRAYIHAHTRRKESLIGQPTCTRAQVGQGRGIRAHAHAVIVCGWWGKTNLLNIIKVIIHPSLARARTHAHVTRTRECIFARVIVHAGFFMAQIIAEHGNFGNRKRFRSLCTGNMNIAPPINLTHHQHIASSQSTQVIDTQLVTHIENFLKNYSCW